MTSRSRRGFLKDVSATVACLALAGNSRFASATPLSLPLGLQLYSVREQLPKDYEGTLKQLGQLGFQEVEAAGFYNHDATQVSAAMKNAGLRCVSAHYGYDVLHAQLDQIIEFGTKIGLGYIICSYPGHKNPPAMGTANSRGQRPGFTMEDWRWNAEQFNGLGEKIKAAGMKFGYHNHTMEFVEENGTIPFDELLKLTDPSKVTMEMDCGWVMVGGKNPAEYLKKYPDRFSMLHIKDFKTLPQGGSNDHPPAAAELGRGAIDYKPIFAAANKAAIKHIFVEQEEFDMAPMDALRVDADYIRAYKG